MRNFVFVKDQFSPAAKEMRSQFEAKMGNPKHTHAGRFVWDFWHVPNQYTLLRTPADQFFSPRLYQNFLHHLAKWGRENLGCSAITPPWLSCYPEGCEQKLHSDVPHGPWAFVFSLSPQKSFKGGETVLLRPEVLDYWKGFQDAEDRELSSFVKTISPKFNRLVVFDPRIPHGVNRVSGTMDPMESRLVVHGWFTEPRPYLEGALTARKAAPVLNEAVERFSGALLQTGNWHGVMSLRLEVSAKGECRGLKILANTVVSLDGTQGNLALLAKKSFSGLRFPSAASGTKITLPLLFR